MDKRDSRFKLTVEQEADVVERYKNGDSLVAIAEDFGVSRWTIRNAVQRAEIEVKSRGNRYREFSDEELADMAARYERGESQETIAAAYSSTQLVVSRVLRQHRLIPDRKGARGKRSNFWKGGRVRTGEGYWLVYVFDDDPLAAMRTRSGYVLEHRMVMARKLGRPLERYETVHHINGDVGDNRPENLQLRTGRHGNGIMYRCMDCGSFHVAPVEIG